MRLYDEYSRYSYQMYSESIVNEPHIRCFACGAKEFQPYCDDEIQL